MERRMKENLIAISATAEGAGLDAGFEPLFGRAPRFLIVDVETGEHVRLLSNLASLQPHGAGPAAASLVADAGACAVVAGRFGPNAAQILTEFGLSMLVAPEGLSMHEIIERYREGRLPSAGA